MPRRRSRGRGGPTVKRPVGWVRTLFINQSADAAPVISEGLVVVGDWGIGTLNERATLTRIVGLLMFHAPPGIAADVTLFMAIYLTDVDTVDVAPDTSAILAEDLLWMDAVTFPDAGTVNARNAERLRIDVKAQRVMQSDQTIRMVFVTDVGQFVSWNGFLSCLVKRGASA